MNELLEIIRGLIPDVEITETTDLLESKLLDSITTVELTALLEEEFDIEFTPVDVVPANFQTPEAIFALVERKMEE